MSDTIPACPAPDRNPHPPRFAMPDLACDTHVHVFGAHAAYPFQATRAYTPPEATVEQMLALHDVLGISRAVIVQASAYGTDNRALLDAVAAYPDRLRGIASVTEDVSEDELRRLHDGGVRGIRVNLVDKGGMPFSSLSALRHMGERIRDMGWHIEFLVHVESNAEFRELVPSLPVPVSVGHIGYTKPPNTVDHRGYREFLALLKDGQCWVKLTGSYRISARDAFPYDDVQPFAEAVVAAAPDRVIWGSDWPHVIHYREMPNDGDLLDALGGWVPDPTLRERILVRNPAQLYGFV
jgi:2-pyrone-4,6-dicarboxylate lactonase